MKSETSNLRRKISQKIIWLATAALFLAAGTCTAHAQTTIGGHIGFVLPLVTHAGGNTTTIADNFAIGFPMGVTFKGKGRMALDLEFVHLVQDEPRQVSLFVDP